MNQILIRAFTITYTALSDFADRTHDVLNRISIEIDRFALHCS